MSDILDPLVRQLFTPEESPTGSVNLSAGGSGTLHGNILLEDDDSRGAREKHERIECFSSS